MRFFHCHATRRFRKNVIRGIMDESNNWRVDPNDIAALLIKYYQNLLTSSKPNAHGVALDHIPNVITGHMNDALGAPFREDEVKEALKQMASLKAPGPDGMPPLFYQHFWGVVDRDVTNSVLTWLNSGQKVMNAERSLISLRNMKESQAKR